jgi:hypothetical protein
MRLLNWLALIGCGALLACGGCKKLSFPQKAKADKPDDHAAKADLPGGVTGEGWHIHWETPDPAHPGSVLTLMDADARRGEMADSDEDDTVLLYDVRAKLYRNGKYVANIVAPTATASQHRKTVDGSGGVTLVSVSDPPNTVVTADTMNWNINTDKIVATGHAHITRSAKGNEKPFTQTGDKVIYDTKRKDFVMQ